MSYGKGNLLHPGILARDTGWPLGKGRGEHSEMAQVAWAVDGKLMSTKRVL